MARLVSKEQPLVKGVYYPRGVYSRVVLLQVAVPLPVGSWAYEATDVLGERLWLRGVDFWFQTADAAAYALGWVYLRAGSGPRPTNQAAVVAWDNIVPARGAYNNMIFFQGHEGHMHFELNRLYEGPPRRLAAAFQNAFGSDIFFATVAFQISEG